MAKLKAARATDVPSAMPEPDIAADLDGLAAASAASSCSCIRGTYVRGHANVRVYVLTLICPSQTH
jgi:hypothetical protein